MVGHGERRHALRRLQAEAREELADVLGQARDAGRRFGPGRVFAQHEAVVLDRGAAARGVDDHGVEAAALELARPGGDVGPGRVQGRPLHAQVVGQRAAAAGAPRHHHLDPMAGQDPDRRLVDLGRQDLLGAAGHQRDPGAPRPLGREDLGPVDRAGRCQVLGRQAEHRPELSGKEAGEGAAEPGGGEREPEQRRPRHGQGQDPAQQAVHQRAPIGLLDPAPPVIDQVHVVHARGAGRHAGEAGQAAVQVPRYLGLGRPVVLQHLLDQVDPAARRVELVAEQHVGRAGRRAEAAVHAGAQDLLGFRGIGIGQLGQGEVGLHRLSLPPPCARD